MSTVADIQETTPAWRKSSYSVNHGACVEVGTGTRVVLIRDSVDPTGPALRYSPQTWRAFVRAALGHAK
jgi:Domain of unknown function (DUF397)